MELNHDCVRAILIWTETNVQMGQPQYTDSLFKDTSFSKWTDDEIIYCVAKLNEAGFLDGGAIVKGNQVSINAINSLTWAGHTYLDTIRDDKVWRKTKSVLSDLKSASLSTAGKVAETILLGIIKKKTGLPL
ncbi:DUF2513 domain-containing protein [Lactiplantibacillus daowaiensis]|uniref:DUF2513 domain-containing protein n=1 Tax=Lactiplantibacillus daowaiensis TaxID=2559918 RepID=A0ABW1RX08_9LACO|nr:DUF2513 domain-containing protein [Lactiplantibacillus daowaiensis]